MTTATCSAGTGGTASSQQASSPGRALHLIDLENLAGGPERLRRTPTVGEQYRTIAPVSPTDVVTVGTDITNVFAAADQFPGAGRRAGTGPSGADLALMASADPAWIAARFEAVVIASGDGDFALHARACKEQGLRVVVVASPSRLSRALARVADEIIDFPESDPAPVTDDGAAPPTDSDDDGLEAA